MVSRQSEPAWSVVPGEIAIVAGIEGEGQRALAEEIAGYRPISGTVRLDGVSLKRASAEERARRGIAFISDDRTGEASIPAWPIRANIGLKRPRDRKPMSAVAFLGRWRVTPSAPEAPFGTLSGGNMQRVLVGRELDRDPRVLIALNPTHGLDVPSTRFVWDAIRDHCAEGGCALVFSSDLDEAIAEGDCVAVMRSGSVSPFLPVSEVTRHDLGRRMVLGWS